MERIPVQTGGACQLYRVTGSRYYRSDLAVARHCEGRYSGNLKRD